MSSALTAAVTDDRRAGRPRISSPSADAIAAISASYLALYTQAGPTCPEAGLIRWKAGGELATGAIAQHPECHCDEGDFHHATTFDGGGQ